MDSYDVHNFFDTSMEGFLRGSRIGSLASLTKEQIFHAVKSACDFFGLPMPQAIEDKSCSPDGATRVCFNNTVSVMDDVIQFNMVELAYLNVGTLDAFSIIMTHECGHRMLQRVRFNGPQFGAWTHELAADFFMGIRGGYEDMKAILDAADGLSKESASKSHPAGFLRKNFIDKGIALGFAFRQQKEQPTPKKMYDAFVSYYITQRPIIEQEEKKIYNFIERKLNL